MPTIRGLFYAWHIGLHIQTSLKTNKSTYLSKPQHKLLKIYHVMSVEDFMISETKIRLFVFLHLWSAGFSFYWYCSSQVGGICTFVHMTKMYIFCFLYFSSHYTWVKTCFLQKFIQNCILNAASLPTSSSVLFPN